MARLLRRKELGPAFNIWFSATHLQRMYTPGNPWYCGFPAPTKLGTRFIAWWDYEIEAWLASRPKKELSPLPVAEHLESPLGRPLKASDAMTDFSK